MYAEVCRGRSQVTAVSWPAWDARNLGTTEVTAMIAQVTWKDTDVSAKRIYSTKQHQESLAAPKWEQWRWIYYMSHWTSLNNTWSHCRSCDLASSEGLQRFLGELGGAAPRDQRAQWRPEPPDVRCNVFDSLNGIGISMILRSIHLPIIFLSVQCCNGTSSGSAMHPSRTEARQFRPPQARWCARKKNDMAHYASQFLIFFLNILIWFVQRAISNRLRSCVVDMFGKSRETLAYLLKNWRKCGWPTGIQDDYPKEQWPTVAKSCSLLYNFVSVGLQKIRRKIESPCATHKLPSQFPAWLRKFQMF